MFASARGVLGGFLFGMLVLCPAIARAQDAPSGAVGQVEGKDISVDGGTAARGGTATAPSIYVSNGSVVTVHAGKARMILFAGGEVEICGPAKFTVLLSGNAITLALNFGRLRVELPAETTLRVFTPTIIGTPIDISGGLRDVTVGLNLDDSLCVLTTSGAIQLEHQFTGEKLIVPQAGEFFLNSGKLLPVAAAPGSCQCLADEPSTLPPPPAAISEFAVAAPASPAPKITEHSAQAAAEQPKPSIEYSVLAHANEAHPVTPSAKDAALADPASSMPMYAAVVPVLTFSADSPAPPPGPSQDMILLIREARVSPEWEFSGRVEPPEFAQAMQHSLGESASAANAESPAAPAAGETAKKKNGGLWAAVKRVFGRGETKN